MNYKTILLIVFFFVACKEGTIQQTEMYDNLLFERKGGGDLVFNIYPTLTTNLFLCNITRINYLDTVITLNLTGDNKNTETFHALTNALNGLTPISGDFKQDTTSFIGTWAYLYLGQGKNYIEVTNTDLRNMLLKFESMVREKLK